MEKNFVAVCSIWGQGDFLVWIDEIKRGTFIEAFACVLSGSPSAHLQPMKMISWWPGFWIFYTTTILHRCSFNIVTLRTPLPSRLNKHGKSHQKSTFAKTNAETKMWARPGMETRKTIAIFSICQRPTSPGILDFCFTFDPIFGFLLYFFWISLKKSAHLL